MTTDLKETAKWWGDLLKVVATSSAIVMVLMKTQFPTREEMEIERDQRRKIAESVLLLTEQRRVLEDFEARIRSLERRGVAGGRQLDGLYDK